MIDLARARAERGLTQQDLARKVGLVRQTISHIECGRILPSVPTAQAIARALGLDWTQFFTE